MTVEGETFPLAEPFHVLATANPVEYEGTYPLPEAQLDRFLLRVSFGYPTSNEEYDVLARRLERQQEEVVLDPVTDADGLLALQRPSRRCGSTKAWGATASTWPWPPGTTTRC